MRLFLLLLFFISFNTLADKHTMAGGIVLQSKGQTRQTACIVGDPRIQCCQTTKTNYQCSSRPNPACCGALPSGSTTPECDWVTDTTTCKNHVPFVCTSGLKCTQRQNYECCNSGTNCRWYDNKCRKGCNSETKNHCYIATRRHDPAVGTVWSGGTCINGGSCSYSCKDGVLVKNNNTCTAPLNCTTSYTPDATRCPSITLGHGNSTSRGCNSGYTGTCIYSCHNGTMTGSRTCSVSQCTAPAKQTGCLAFSGRINSGTSQSRSCEPSYTGSGCSYTCTNGNPTSITNNCSVRTDNPCNARTYSSNEVKNLIYISSQVGGWIIPSCSLSSASHNGKTSCEGWSRKHSLLSYYKIDFKCNNGNFVMGTRCPLTGGNAPEQSGLFYRSFPGWNGVSACYRLGAYGLMSLHTGGIARYGACTDGGVHEPGPFRTTCNVNGNWNNFTNENPSGGGGQGGGHD